VGLAVSLLLIGAAGTILISDVDPGAERIGTDQLGWILLVTGLIGLALSLIFWSSWGGFRAGSEVAGDMRSTMFSVGLAMTSLLAYVAMDLVVVLGYEKTLLLVFAYAFAGAAIAVPFAGAVAAAMTERWRPLVRGSVLGVTAVAAIWVLLVAT
jgi:hypothetical protein